MAISQEEFRKAVYHKTGTIYVARNATYMIFVIDGGHTYAASCTNGGGIIVDPAPVWWTGSIDVQGSWGDYFTYGMIPSENPPYKAKSYKPITDEDRADLRRRYGSAA